MTQIWLVSWNSGRFVWLSVSRRRLTAVSLATVILADVSLAEDSLTTVSLDTVSQAKDSLTDVTLARVNLANRLADSR